MSKQDVKLSTIHSALAGGQSTRSNAVSKCIKRIVEGIRTRHYLPDQKLGEATLAKELKVGKAQVRAALDQLATIGVVERKPRSGTYVRSLKVQHYIELMEIRAVLEGFAARVASVAIKDEELKQLGQLADEVDKTIFDDTQSWERVTELESQFHTQLAEAGGNLTLVNLIARHNFLARHLTEGYLINLPIWGATVFGYDPHRRVVEALATRDPAKAELEARSHILVPLFIQMKPTSRLPDVNLTQEDRTIVRHWLVRAARFIDGANDFHPRSDQPSAFDGTNRSVMMKRQQFSPEK